MTINQGVKSVRWRENLLWAMKIRTATIKNFKCLGPEPVTIDLSEDIVVLIGENNVGKSSVLAALNIFLSGAKSIDKDCFCNHKSDEANAIEITLEFDNLTEQDKQHPAVRSYAWQKDGSDVWILKKKYYYAEGKAERTYFAIVETEERANPRGLTTNCDDLFSDEKMQKIYIEAIKDVSDTSGSNSKSAFGQIFNLMIQPELETKPEYRELENAVTAFKDLFQGASRLGQVSALEGLLTGKIQRVINAATKIVVDTPSLSTLPTPKLLTNDNREINVLPEHQGHGLQRAVIFSLLEALAEQHSPPTKLLGPRNLLLVEEPEIYMHPQMERKIADTLYEIAKSGVAQVICTTHSPVFIRVAEQEKALVRLVRNASNVLKAIQQHEEMFPGASRAEQKKRLKMVTDFDPTVNEVFFARRVVLVEGDTEIAVFPEAAQLLNLFRSPEHQHKLRDTTFINCRGKWTIAAFQEVLNKFGIPYVVIHDTDEDLENGANERIAQTLSGNLSMAFPDKIETTLGMSSSQTKDKPIRAVLRIRELHEVGELNDKIGDFVRFAYGIS
jgi:predicted ATP-dependent endonuclease of OLD family